MDIATPDSILPRFRAAYGSAVNGQSDTDILRTFRKRRGIGDDISDRDLAGRIEAQVEGRDNDSLRRAAPDTEPLVARGDTDIARAVQSARQRIAEESPVVPSGTAVDGARVVEAAGDDPSIIDKALNTAKAIGRGFTRMVPDVMDSAAAGAQNIDRVIPDPVSGVLGALVPGGGALSVIGGEGEEIGDAIFEASDAVRGTLEGAMPSDPRLADSYAYNKLPEAIGQVGGLMAATVATRNPKLAIGLGAAQNAGQSYREAEQAGASETRQLLSYLGGGAIGTTEAYSPLKAFQRLNRMTGGRLAGIAKQAIKEGGEEAVQELVQTLSNNALARSLYDKDREFLGGLFDALTVGGGAGAVVGALTQALLGRRARISSSPETAPDRVQTESVGFQTDSDRVQTDSDRVQTAPGTDAPAPLSQVVPQSEQSTTEASEQAPAGEPETAPPTAAVEPAAEAAVEQPAAESATEPAPADGPVGEAELDTPVPAVPTPVPAPPASPVEGDSPAADAGAGEAVTEAEPVAAQGLDLRTMETKAKSLFQREFTSRGDLPAPVFDAKVRTGGQVNAVLKRVEFTLRDFQKGLRQAYGRAVPADRVQEIDDALKGQVDIDTLPEPVRAPVRTMRRHIDAMSRRMINSGVVEGSLVPVIDANQGVYVTRSYRKHDDPKWAEKVPAETRNRAKAFLRSKYPNRTEQQVDTLIEELLYSEDAPISVLSGGKIGAKDLGITKRRKPIAEPIRALMGEYRDPRTNYIRSVAKMAHLVGNHEFLEQSRAAGMGDFFFEQDDPNRPPEAKAQIAAEGSDTMSPLNGLYTTPEIKAAFERATSRVSFGPVYTNYLRALGAAKYGKTVLSPITQVRNFGSNAVIALAQGHIGWRDVPQAARAVWSEVSGKGSDATRQYVQEATRYGVLDDDVRSGELEDLLADADYDVDLDRFSESMWTQAGKSVPRIATKLYRAGDAFWKAHAWEIEKRRYREAYPEASEAEIKRVAADVVRNTYPTYSLVPNAVKWLRRSPLVSSFASFPAEVVRITFHTATQIKKDVSDPRTRSIGLKRAAGSLAAATIVGQLANHSLFEQGMTEDEEEDLRFFLAPWEEDSALYHLESDEEGVYRFVDLSYTDPYSYIRKAAMTALRGQGTPAELAVRIGAQLLEPFVSTEILTEKVLDVSRNKTMNGGRVYNPADPTWKQGQDIIAHLYDGVEPGALSSAERIMRATGDETNTYGTDYRVGDELTAITTGFRIRTVDIKQSLKWKGVEYNRLLSDASRGFNSVLTRRGRVSDKEIADAYRNLQQSRERILSEATGAVSKASNLGMSDRDIMIYLGSSFNKKNTAAVLRGQPLPYTGNALRDRIKDARAQGNEDDVAELRRRARLLAQLQRETLREMRPPVREPQESN